MMVLLKKCLRTMMEKKAQYLSAFILVCMSSFLFYSFVSAGINLRGNLNDFYRTHHVEDAEFFTAQPLKDLKTIEKQYDLKLEKRMMNDVKLNTQTTLRLLNVPVSINQAAVMNGTALKNEHDLLIDSGFAAAHHFKIGQRLTVKGNSFVIRGFMTTPDYIYPLESTSDFLKNSDRFGIGLVKSAALEKLGNTQFYYSVRFLDNNESEFKKSLNHGNQVVQWTDQKDNSRISFVKNDIDGIKQMGQTFPIGILLITIVIVLILLWRMLRKEYVQIGILYALGFSKRQIIGHYLSYPFIISLAGGIVGTFAGYLCIRPIMNMYAAFYNLPVLTIHLYPIDLLIALFLPALFCLPLTLILVYRILRIAPVDLMRGGNLNPKIGLLERIVHLKKGKFNTKFKLREILRSLPRVLFLVIGSLFATLLILLGFITQDSMDNLINHNFRDVNHYRYNYTFNRLQTSPPANGDIADLAPFKITAGEQSLIIYGLKPDNQTIWLKNREGKRLSFSQTIINQSLADKLKVGPGDKIKVKNQLNGRVFTVRLDAIADSYLGDYVYMPLSEFNRLNGFPKQSYIEIYSQKRLDINSRDLSTLVETSTMIKGYQNLIAPLKMGIYVMALGAMLIAFIIMYVLLSLLIDENSSKIALMKILGYDDRLIRKLLVNYNVWFVILGFVIGVPAAIQSVSVLFESVMKTMSLAIPIHLSWQNMFVSFILLMIAFYGSLWFNQKRIQKISMHEVINRNAE